MEKASPAPAKIADVRSTWTDDRLDDLNRRVDNGFNRVEARFESLESRIDARFDALNRTILQVGGGMIATFLVCFLGLLVAQA
jgi:hypothetical protein